MVSKEIEIIAWLHGGNPRLVSGFLPYLFIQFTRSNQMSKTKSPFFTFAVILMLALVVVLLGSMPEAVQAQEGTDPTPEPRIVGGDPADPGE